MDIFGRKRKQREAAEQQNEERKRRVQQVQDSEMTTRMGTFDPAFTVLDGSRDLDSGHDSDDDVAPIASAGGDASADYSSPASDSTDGGSDAGGSDSSS